MDDITYNEESLRRHRVSYSDIDEVLDINNKSRCDFDMELSMRNNPRIMFVGYNLAARLLEVGVEFMDENRIHIFHTQTVSPHYRKLYEGK